MLLFTKDIILFVQSKKNSPPKAGYPN